MLLDDGTAVDQWTSFEIRDSFTDPLGSADFEFRPSRGKINNYSERVRKGRLVGVVVGGITQGSFLIQSVTKTIDRGGVTFKVHCESVLATPYQASVDPDIAKHYASDAPVTTVVLEALAPFGFTTITGDTAASRTAMTGAPIGGAKVTPVETLKHKDAQAKDDETAYAFCSRIFTRLGVCLRVDAKGELVLAAPDYSQAPIYTLVQDYTGANQGDHMLDGIVIEDSNDDQFSEVYVRGLSTDTVGQKANSLPVARVRAATLPIDTTDEEKAALDAAYKAAAAKTSAAKVPITEYKPKRPTYSSVSMVAPWKPKIIRDKNARDAARAQSVGKLAMGLRAVKAYSVACEVDGLVSREGKVWTVDTVANVVIDVEGLREPMWILERTLVMDAQGQRTRLKLLPLGALTLGDAPS